MKILKWIIRMEKLTIETRWAPTVNHLWKTSGHKRYLTPEALRYIVEVKAAVPWGFKCFTEPVQVTIIASPPDKRKRDLDNLGKIIFDSLTKAGVYTDDHLVHKITITKAEIVKPNGRMIITVESLKGA